jgi:hypothetical protein
MIDALPTSTASLSESLTDEPAGAVTEGAVSEGAGAQQEPTSDTASILKKMEEAEQRRKDTERNWQTQHQELLSIKAQNEQMQQQLAAVSAAAERERQAAAEAEFNREEREAEALLDTDPQEAARRLKELYKRKLSTTPPETTSTLPEDPSIVQTPPTAGETPAAESIIFEAEKAAIRSVHPDADEAFQALLRAAENDTALEAAWQEKGATARAAYEMGKALLAEKSDPNARDAKIAALQAQIEALQNGEAEAPSTLTNVASQPPAKDNQSETREDKLSFIDGLRAPLS